MKRAWMAALMVMGLAWAGAAAAKDVLGVACTNPPPARCEAEASRAYGSGCRTPTTRICRTSPTW
jgi:hypothetical protein